MATLYILYGSATGNAEYIAKDLAAKGPPAPFTSVVCDAMEKFKKYSDDWAKPPSHNGMKKHALLFICSTTGNGDFPENASRFARYIKRKTTIDAKAFQHVNYAVLGLGDTNYDIFCAAAKSLDKKLEENGGTRIKPLACADEATGLEDVVEPWTESIFQDISQACIVSGSNDCDDAQPTATSRSNQPEEKSKDEGNKENKTAPASTLNATTKAPAPKPKMLDKTLKSESPLFILYGSATGNAEQIAKDLAATYSTICNNPDAFTYFPSVVCTDMNGWRKQCLPIWEQAPARPGAKHGVVIVTSTTGNGEPTENSERFVRWLKRKQTATAMPLKHCAFSVLGLGDTNYDVFCAMGKTVDKKLEDLGGTRAKPLACADEATGLEEAVDPWVNSILLDISIACQGISDGNSPTVDPILAEAKPASPKTREDMEEAEEKKMDASDVIAPPPLTLPVEQISTGVQTICSILKLDCSCPLDEVDRTCLPKIGTSLSSCQLLTELEQEQALLDSVSADDDRLTVSSASSSAIHYTLKKPFESILLNARYLTATPTDAAVKAAEAMNGSRSDCAVQRAMDIYTEHFPLVVSEQNTKQTVERNGKRVIELTLALPDDFTLEYNPGDSLGLIVNNPPEAVEFVLGMLKETQEIDPDQKVLIDNGQPITVREAISQEIDLCSPLKSKRILSSLSQHATNQEDRKALQLLASKTPEGEKVFEEFIDKQRLSVVDILREFPSCQSIPLTALLSILPSIPPRYYSVSSSPLVNQQSLSLTVSFSVVDYVTPSLKVNGNREQGLRRKKGIATRYLEALASSFLAGAKSLNGTEVPSVKIFPKPTAEFRMPARLTTPMILIGPGTGIAPFMGFLQHRRAILSNMESKQAATSVVEGTWRGGYEMEEEELKISKGDVSGLSIGADFVNKNLEHNVGSVDVFFGCRHRDHDWLYRSSMEEMKQQGIISNLYAAFSRDSNYDDGAVTYRQKYVQDIMLHDDDCASRLQKLITEENASVFVCGDGNAMAKDVQGALTRILGRALGGDEAGKEYVETMKKDKRYLIDIWTA